MSFLNKVEDWIIRNTMKPSLKTSPISIGPKDDVPISLALFVLLELGIVATCSYFLGK